MRTQKITRQIEECGACGAWNSFRIDRTAIVNGQKRGYAKCRVCGHRAVITWREKQKVSNL